MIDSRLDRIETKLDRVLEIQNAMNVTQAKQAVDIEHHIKRTDLLEARLDDTRKLVYMGAGICALLALLAKAVL
jgi:N-acetylmuramic acid 6-phosphate (MurNAc-6-P) etherase